MKKLFICILLWNFAFDAKAQTNDDFEKFGKLVFSKLIVEEHYNEVSIIWIEQYQDFIDSQENLSDSRKRTLKNAVEKEYKELYMEYQDSYMYFEQSYNQAKLEGAEFEYTGTRWTEKEDEFESTYSFEVSFIYKSDKVQNEVVISFDAAWYKENFVLISGFKENF